MVGQPTIGAARRRRWSAHNQWGLDAGLRGTATRHPPRRNRACRGGGSGGDGNGRAAGRGGGEGEGRRSRIKISRLCGLGSRPSTRAPYGRRLRVIVARSIYRYRAVDTTVIVIDVVHD